MQRLSLILILILTTSLSYGQWLDPEEIEPDSSSFAGVYVKSLHTDSFQSTYMIWVKDKVPPHFHAHHTEYIHVISGKGIMTLGDSTFKVKKGDAVIIPCKTIHSVQTASRKPLKVISIQAPKFDGDRVWVD